MSIFSAISWREQVIFNEIMMMSVFYYINTLSWIFILLGPLKNVAGKILPVIFVTNLQTVMEKPERIHV
jgi:hypothetical protein